MSLINAPLRNGTEQAFLPHLQAKGSLRQMTF